MRPLIFSIIVLSFVACSQPQKGGMIDSMFTQTDSIFHSVLNAHEHLWGTPFAMQYIDSLIFVYDEKSESGLFHLYDIKNDTVTDFGRKGQGKNEFIMPMEFQICNDTTATIFDYANKNLYCYNPKNIIEGELSFSICYKDTFPTTVKLFKTKYNTVLDFGFHENCMFMLKQMNGKIIKKSKEFPYRDMNEKRIDNRLRGMAYQGILRNNPSNDKFIYATNSADIIYFYKIDSMDVTPIRKYEFNYPGYKPVQGNNSRSAPISTQNIKTFIDGTATDKYVYVLYSGKCFKDAGLRAFEGNVIYVFDWNGDAVKKYLLDIPVFRICVDKKGNTIYAFSNNPECVLTKFDL